MPRQQHNGNKTHTLTLDTHTRARSRPDVVWGQLERQLQHTHILDTHTHTHARLDVVGGQLERQ